MGVEERWFDPGCHKVTFLLFSFLATKSIQWWSREREERESENRGTIPECPDKIWTGGSLMHCPTHRMPLSFGVSSYLLHSFLTFSLFQAFTFSLNRPPPKESQREKRPLLFLSLRNPDVLSSFNHQQQLFNSLIHCHPSLSLIIIIPPLFFSFSQKVKRKEKTRKEREKRTQDFVQDAKGLKENIISPYRKCDSLIFFLSLSLLSLRSSHSNCYLNRIKLTLILIFTPISTHLSDSSLFMFVSIQSTHSSIEFDAPFLHLTLLHSSYFGFIHFVIKILLKRKNYEKNGRKEIQPSLNLCNHPISLRKSGRQYYTWEIWIQSKKKGKGWGEEDEQKERKKNGENAREREREKGMK